MKKSPKTPDSHFFIIFRDRLFSGYETKPIHVIYFLKALVELYNILQTFQDSSKKSTKKCNLKFSTIFGREDFWDTKIETGHLVHILKERFKFSKNFIIFEKFSVCHFFYIMQFRALGGKTGGTTDLVERHKKRKRMFQFTHL